METVTLIQTTAARSAHFRVGISEGIDIVVPVYHEQALFEKFYHAAARRIRTPWRMLVVYDEPHDSTLTVAAPIAARDPRVVLVRNPHRGVAEAIKTGFAHTRAPAVFLTAIDVSEDLELADALFGLLMQGGNAIAAPSRYMRGGGREAGAFIPRTLSRIASLTLHWFAGIPIHDATSGSKMYRKSFLDSIAIESAAGWSVALELTVKAHAMGFAMAEIPVRQKKREAGDSKFKLLQWLPHYLHWYWYALRHRRGPGALS